MFILCFHVAITASDGDLFEIKSTREDLVKGIRWKMFFLKQLGVHWDVAFGKSVDRRF